jgi:DNA-3-methyladenine glycosylase II
MRVIETAADIEEGLAHLASVDPRLAPVIDLAGEVPVRRREAGFAGLLHIVVSQQLSAASAEAIWGRVESDLPSLTPSAIADLPDEALRAAGLSAPKIRTMRAVAEACLGGLDLEGLADRPAEEAHAALTAVKGIGPWTADIYLLFCLGHADVFPVGDLALRMGVGAAFGLEPAPSPNELTKIVAPWTPWRGVAACLFWSYYRALADARRSGAKQ